MDGYDFEFLNSSSNAGGVGAYIAQDINYTTRDDLRLNLPHCEDLWLNVPLANGKPIIVGIIYRHPGHKYDNFTNKLCFNLNLLNTTKSNYIIVGDLNIDILKFNLASNITDYVNSLHSVGSNICIDRPTRVTSHGASCIDHIYTNLSCDELDTNVILSDVSDHFSTLTKIKNLARSNKLDFEDTFVRNQI